MADKALIIRLLEQVRRRVRSKRRLNTVSKTLSIALAFPVVFKLIDLLSPFRGVTVAISLSVWGAATTAWLIWKTRSTATTLSDAAASLDQAAQLNDELKTAYWFIVHPVQSEWVDVQIHKAVETARQLHIDTLYSRTMPRTFYKAAGLALALLALNVLPLSWNHNWMLLQGAPPFALSGTDQAIVNHAKKLLDKSGMAGELEKIIDNLQQGKISSEQAQQQISDLRQQMDGGNLELNNILDALASMANELGQSPELASTAQAMSEGDPGKAADQIRDLAQKLGTASGDALRNLQKSMSQAASNSPAALQDLSQMLQKAADALKNADPQTEKAAMENLAQALDQLAQKMQGQQQQNQAGRQLADLQNALQQEGAAESEASDAQQAQSSASSNQGQGANGENSGNPGPNGTPQAGKPSGNGQGSGSMSTSASGSNQEQKSGQLTKLDVQLKMEGLRGQAGKSEQLQDIEEASKQERSAMDYRNVPSQLSPAQKDALNQNRLPREQREIVKTYFEEIRPQASKTTAPTKP